ncbi:protein sprouty homolog 2 [Trichomycterus rosablanca]|uniref:protein sprouty homolog 2 n=1 Tax=Trichomycterus rosablanca TaxID=2290929 RepID=UPI002F3590E0
MDSGDQDGGSSNGGGGSGGLLTLQLIQAVHSCNEYTQSPATWSAVRPEPASCMAMGVKPGDPKDTERSLCLLEGSTDAEPLDAQKGSESVTGDQLRGSDKLRLLGNVVETVAVIETQPTSCRFEQDDLELQGSPSSKPKCPKNEGDLEAAIQEQPRSLELNKEATKLLVSASPEENLVKLESKEHLKKSPRTHPWPCDSCGRCRCKRCASAAPLPLPSCLLCGQRCFCSAESTIDYVTCACCLKALLYHCGSDDEDSSADAPFSCRRQNWCKRWSATAAVTLVLPCLLCYGPLRGCQALCQLCYNCVNRPGCRCKNMKTEL